MVGLTEQVLALIDDYVAAWNVQDGQAVVALMTEDGKHFSGGAANVVPEDGVLKIQVHTALIGGLD
jgi:ketosteroid isomerase-like protein